MSLGLAANVLSGLIFIGFTAVVFAWAMGKKIVIKLEDR